MSILMKDSGVEWIGQIPETWQIVRIKDISENVKTGKTPPSKVKDFFTDGEIDWFTPGDMNELILNNSSNRKIIKEAIIDGHVPFFKKDTIFLVGIGATVGKVSLSPKESSCNQQINAIEFNKVFPKYGLYYLTILSEEIQKFASFVTLPIFTQTETKQLKITFPKKEEQKQIANFLDKQTSKIDKVIKTKQQQLRHLEELKKSIIHNAVTKGLDDSVEMIDSKIEWIGNIPKHWTTQMLKRTTYIKGRIGWQGLTSEEYQTEGEYLLVTGTDFKGKYINWNTCHYVEKERYDEDKKIQLKEKDILVTKDGTIGKIAMVKEMISSNYFKQWSFCYKTFKR